MNLDYPLGSRFYEKSDDKHCLPFTLEFVGLQGEIFGVKASIYDPRTTIMSNLFLVCFNTFVDIDLKKFGISSDKPSHVTNPMYFKKHKILGFYKFFGFEKLRNSIVEIRKGKQPALKKNKLNGSYFSWFNNIDQYFTVWDVIN